MKKCLSGFFTGPQSSPDGKYLYFFRDKNWWIYSILPHNKPVTSHKISKATFWNTRDDHTASKPPFGMGGWLKGDKEMLLLYDEYNIWAVKP